MEGIKELQPGCEQGLWEAQEGKWLPETLRENQRRWSTNKGVLDAV